METVPSHIEMEEKQATEDIVSLSSTTEERERKLFMGDINKFMAEIGKPLSKIPIMGYKELDLFQLFREVTAHGGFIEVVKNVGTWSKIWKRLGNFDPSITDSSFRLKKNYERYLLDYEYKLYPDHKLQALELERQVQLKKQHGVVERPRSPTESIPKKPTIAPVPSVAPKNMDVLKIRGKKGKRKSYAGYKDIVRDQNGVPLMPLCLGELIVESLGTLIPNTPYISEKHIWPIGFKSYRYFSSMVNPEIRVKYTSTIVDAGDKPQFVVTAEDEPNNSIISYSPSGAWRTVLKRVMAKSGGEEARKSISVSGTLRFGLAHPIVSLLVRELPGADKLVELIGYSSSPSSSPTLGRRRRSSSEEDEEEYSDSDYEEAMASTKRAKRDMFGDSSISFSNKEMYDLELAVSTLQALKYCTVY